MGETVADYLADFNSDLVGCVLLPAIDVNYVYSRENLGFSAGNNKLVRQGTSPLILLLNDDVFMYPNSINKMVMAMDDPTLGVVGAKLIFDPESKDRGRPAGAPTSGTGSPPLAASARSPGPPRGGAAPG